LIICVRFGQYVIRDDRLQCIAPIKSRKYQTVAALFRKRVSMAVARPEYSRHVNRSKAASAGAMDIGLSDPAARLRYQRNLKSVMQINHLDGAGFIYW
jgi:hypothetical protein